MEEHRKNVACANCHAKMDDMGFAFENFNANRCVANKGWRVRGRLGGDAPRWPKVQWSERVKKLLKEQKELVARNVAEKLLTYALGRGLEWYDKRPVDQIVAGPPKANTSSRPWAEIARSEPFRLRRGSATGDK